MKDYDNPEDRMTATIRFRTFPEEKERFEEYVKNNPIKYKDVSHALRCAIMMLMRPPE